ncbi:serine/threonine protein kinase [Chloropicon primus]|uniref:Serine/threonine protein kinase n=2 Tax=Chloropicon primus TaxID=1764295 RepID=A0A5B8MX64_9CHLO|nr:serine/threonine protein kinase [Chloropicon primus]UPR04596.1 serine/threonine protein kinase [Chloropicon primus]|eukprot:QDZ25398.1 serine/threonine protein kinase [Chloropicon primus]
MLAMDPTTRRLVPGRVPRAAFCVAAVLTFLVACCCADDGSVAILENGDKVEVELRPEYLGPVIWPWRTANESKIPVRSLNTTLVTGERSPTAEPSGNEHDVSVVYGDGALAESWEDKSWNAEVEYASSCPRSAATSNVTSDVVAGMRVPRCVEAAVSETGGLSFGLENSTVSGDLHTLVMWIFIEPPDEEEGAEAGEISSRTVNICDGLAEDDVLCPAVRILAGRIDTSPQEGPLKLFLHKGNSIFSIPLVLAGGGEFAIGDWNRVSIPLGAAGWGGNRDWDRLSIMSNQETEGTRRETIKVYIGTVSLEPRRETAILSQRPVNSTSEEGEIIDESQASRLEEIGVQVKGTSLMGSKTQTKEVLRRKLYDSVAGGIQEGVSDWSWRAEEDEGEEFGLCKTLESFGGLSLKADPAFGKASSLRFSVRPPKTRFYISHGAKIESVMSVRLDATTERGAAKEAEDQAQVPWQTFHTSSMIPMTMPVPELLTSSQSGDHWLTGVLPLTDTSHAWDRISFINTSPGTVSICVENVTAEYLIETVEASEALNLPSVGEEMLTSKSMAWMRKEMEKKMDDLLKTSVTSFAELPRDGGVAVPAAEEDNLPLVFYISMVTIGALTLAVLAFVAYQLVTKGKLKVSMGKLGEFWQTTAEADSLSSSYSAPSTQCERIRFAEIDCDFDYSKAIGLGSTCAVFKGKWKGLDVAIKAIHWAGDGQKPPAGQTAICREMEIISSVRSPFVVGYHGFAHANDTTYLLLEMCFGNLQSCMRKGEVSFSMLQALRILRHVIQGLQHLNEARISHRDVKSSNVLLTRDDKDQIVGKLGDLGVSKTYNTVQQSQLETFCGTPRWMAPEKLCLMGSSNTDLAIGLGSTSPAKADVYSFGIVAWEVIFYCVNGYYLLPFDEYQNKSNSFLSGSGIYDSLTCSTVFNDASNEDPTILDQSNSTLESSNSLARSAVWDRCFEASLYSQIISGARPSLPQDCSSSLADLIKECWSGDPNARPTFSAISKRLEVLIETTI